MKKLKVLFVIALAFCLFTLNVKAEGPDPSNGQVIVDGVVLYEKGAKTSNSVQGVTLDVENLTLTVNTEFTAPNGDGIKVLSMGNNFVIEFDGDVKYTLVERNDGLFISNSTVILRGVHDGGVTLTLAEGSGIIVEKEASLHVENIKLYVGTLRFGDGIVDIWNIADIGETKLYKNGEEIERVYVSIPPLIVEDDTANEPITNNNIVKNDSFAKITVYTIIAGLFVVAAVVVLLMSSKSQKK